LKRADDLPERGARKLRVQSAEKLTLVDGDRGSIRGQTERRMSGILPGNAEGGWRRLIFQKLKL
jgi:hypothetical protein